MQHKTTSRTTGRLAALGVGLGLAAAGLGARAVALVPDVLTPAARVDTWVELLVVAVAAAVAAWVALGSLLGLAVVLSSRAGRGWQAGEAAVRRLAPAMVTRLVRAGVGSAVGAGLVLAPTAAFAAPEPAPAVVAVAADLTGANADTSGHAADRVETAAGGGIDLAWRPTAVAPTAAPSTVGAPVTPAPPAAPVRPVAARPAGDDHVVVHRGDTLWDLAAATLGADATDAQILAETVRWHDANRDVIGDDPDLILPGQILVRPS